MEKLIQYSLSRINSVNTDFKRYLWNKIDWNNRLIAITGARGIGKTTMLLQYIKENIDFYAVQSLKRLLSVIAEIVPFKPNLLKLSQQVEVSRETLLKYLYLLDKADLLKAKANCRNRKCLYCC